MSKIALSPHASGTGVFTIQSPNSNTDRTLVLPDEAGTVLTSASPVIFQVAANSINQSISAAVVTQVQFNTVQIDSHSGWDATNHRYVAPVAGWYWFSGILRFNAGGTVESYLTTHLFKNGVHANTGLRLQTQFNASVINNGEMPFPSGLVYMNGSTDYIDARMECTTASSISDTAVPLTIFTGFLVRAA